MDCSPVPLIASLPESLRRNMTLPPRPPENRIGKIINAQRIMIVGQSETVIYYLPTEDFNGVPINISNLCFPHREVAQLSVGQMDMKIPRSGMTKFKVKKCIGPPAGI
jgi:hypothetical protein